LAIVGFAIAFGVANVSIANASNATAAVATVPHTTTDLIVFIFFIVDLCVNRSIWTFAQGVSSR
jgi:hypothetical protein